MKAAASVPDPKDAKRSWKREYIEQQERQQQRQQQPSSVSPAASTNERTLVPMKQQQQPPPMMMNAFPTEAGQPAFVAGPGTLGKTWLSDEDLVVADSTQQYRTPGGGGDSSDGASPSVPITAATDVLSPRQRRRLDLPGGTSPSVSPPDERKQMAYAFRLPPIGAPAPRSGSSSAAGAASGQPVLAPDRVGHTGTSTYTLSTGEVVSATATQDPTNGIDGAEVGEAATNEPLTELADVVGQLSLNENAEVRYHGRSSGLYLISKSRRYRDFFWHFPSGTYWPQLEGLQRKTEREILGLAEGEDPLPDLETQSHLLMAYWTYVHPHFPVCYKVAFLRQYRHSLAHPDSTEPSTPAGTGKVPTVLLLSMFALAARYCDIDKTKNEGGKLWPAGQEYLDKVRRKKDDTPSLCFPLELTTRATAGPRAPELRLRLFETRDGPSAAPDQLPRSRRRRHVERVDDGRHGDPDGARPRPVPRRRKVVRPDPALQSRGEADSQASVVGVCHPRWVTVSRLGATFTDRKLTVLAPSRQTATRLRTSVVPERSTSATTTAASLRRTNRTSTSSGDRSASTGPSSAVPRKPARKRCRPRMPSSSSRTHRSGRTR